MRIYYGNNTFNPVGVWEARPVPGSPRVMATAAAHHAMTAGSIILLDTTRGIDGLEPITRLTPDALFPESEVPVLPKLALRRWASKKKPRHARRSNSAGRATATSRPTRCRRSTSWRPTASTALIGEPSGNPANMFGLYLVDAFGNKELLYRDLNFCSLWAMPVRPRRCRRAVPSLVEPSDKPEGTFLLQDVHQGWPPLPPGIDQAAADRAGAAQVHAARQHADGRTAQRLAGPAGAGHGAGRARRLGLLPRPVRHRLGVPGPGRARAGRADHAEPDVPAAGRDRRRASAATSRATRPLRPAACPWPSARPPSAIEPGPDGSKPFSYPILVQPVLDRKCVSCHNPQKPEGKVILTGEPQGRYTASYNALAPLRPVLGLGQHPGGMRAGQPCPTASAPAAASS